MGNGKEFKIPKTLGATADLLYMTRQARLDLEEQADELKKNETLLRQHLLANLPKQDSEVIAGRLCRVQVVEKQVFNVEDWDAYRAYIVKTKSWDLLQKRASNAAIKSRFEDGVVVPGTKEVIVPELSVNKL